MGSSWSVGMNMTCWVENRKKGSRNEEIKVEADEPDVRKSELIHFFFFFWWKRERIIWLISNLRSSSGATICSSVAAIKHKVVLRNPNRKLTQQTTGCPHLSNWAKSWMTTVNWEIKSSYWIKSVWLLSEQQRHRNGELLPSCGQKYPFNSMIWRACPQMDC